MLNVAHGKEMTQSSHRHQVPGLPTQCIYLLELETGLCHWQGLHPHLHMLQDVSILGCREATYSRRSPHGWSFPKKGRKRFPKYILLRYTLKADGQRPQLTSHHCGASRFGYNFDYRSNPPFQTCIPRLLLRFAQQQSRAGLATPQS